MRTISLLSLALAASLGAQTLQVPQGGTGGDTAGKAAANLAITQKCPGTSGVGTAYVCVTSGTFTPVDGSVIYFKADVNSGVTPTLSVNTHSATLKTIGGGAIGASDLLAGSWYTVTYHTTSSTYWAVSLPGSAITQLTGDGTAGPGSGSQALTLATVNGSAGACGDATHVCAITTNGKGLVTAQTQTAITLPTGTDYYFTFSGCAMTVSGNSFNCHASYNFASVTPAVPTQADANYYISCNLVTGEDWGTSSNVNTQSTTGFTLNQNVDRYNSITATVTPVVWCHLHHL